MSFLQLAKQRFSSRSYKDTPIEEEKLMTILEAAKIAPTAANRQPFCIIVLRENTIKEKVAATCKYRDWVVQAPVLFVICGDHSKSWKRSDLKDHCDVDAAIVIDHMTLAASDIGLATCWICNFDAKKCSEVLNLPENLEPVALLPLGYPTNTNDSERHQIRKSLDELVYWDGYVK